MISVVCYLVEHDCRIGIHFYHPIQSPTDFIQNIGNAVFAFFTQSIMFIRKYCFIRILLPCKHHLKSCISRSCEVLQIIRSIVPSSSHINIFACACRMIYNKAILLMTFRIQIRIISATLLTHIFKQKIGRAIIYIRVYFEMRRFYPIRFDIIFTILSHFREIQTSCMFHAPPLGVCRYTFISKYNCVINCIFHLKV